MTQTWIRFHFIFNLVFLKFFSSHLIFLPSKVFSLPYFQPQKKHWWYFIFFLHFVLFVLFCYAFSIPEYCRITFNLANQGCGLLFFIFWFLLSIAYRLWYSHSFVFSSNSPPHPTWPKTLEHGITLSFSPTISHLFFFSLFPLDSCQPILLTWKEWVCIPQKAYQ